MEKQIWDFLKKEGFNEYGIAGLMGNLRAESALKPTNLQNSYESKLGYNDDSYTEAVDNGTYTNFVKDAAGYGLAQWTYWSRKQKLLDYAKSTGKSIGDLQMQLEFLVKELKESYGNSVYKVLKEATSVLEASNSVLLNYERPANTSESVQKTRASYGQTYYDKYATSTPVINTITNIQQTIKNDVLIGHSSIDENGKAKGGVAGDQNGKEVCVRDWYKSSWNVLLRCNDSLIAEKMAVACEQACANSNIGYDQNQRNTLYTQAKKHNFDFSKIDTPCECDCSSLMCICAIAAGIPESYLFIGNNMRTTSTMRNAFLNTGKFTLLTDSKYLNEETYLKRGDILIKEGSHTVMVLGNGSGAESATITPPVIEQQPINDALGTAVAKLSMNLRSGPGVSYSTVGSIKAGSTIQVLEITSNNWYKIAWNTASGYAYVSNASNKYFDYIPKGDNSSYEVKVTASSLYVRRGPGREYTARTVVKQNEIYKIVEETTCSEGKKWGLLEKYQSNRDGWVSMSYVKKV